MKVAVLISGQPRNYRLGYEQIEAAYLSKYDCDVFFHAWDSLQHTATQFFPGRPNNEYYMASSWKDELLSLYNPTGYKFDEPMVFDERGVIDPIWRQPLQNSKSMWYSVWQAFLLTKQGYDAYIRTRFDLRYENCLLDLSSLDLSRLHVWEWKTDERVRHRGYYDVFAVGSFDRLGSYSSVYTKIDWYLDADKDYKEFLRGAWPIQDSGLRNEYLLRWHLKQSGVAVSEHPTEAETADEQIIR